MVCAGVLECEKFRRNSDNDEGSFLLFSRQNGKIIDELYALRNERESL